VSADTSLFPKRYIVTLLALYAGTALTYVQFVQGWGGLPLALAIAFTKATLVVLFFMHLIDHRGANRFMFVSSVFFVLVIIAFLYTDVFTRFPLTVP
jgi:cytochrome c oxidase subunit 4